VKPIVLAWGLVFLSALADSFAAFIVKRRFNELGALDVSSIRVIVTYLIEFLKSPVVILGVIAYFSAPALWFVALNRLNLSVAYPVLVGFHVLFVFILAVLFLGEGITTRKIIATLLVLLAVYLIAE